VISVLSGKGGVGKSVIAYNLAERLAALGNRVLLVDGDLTGGNLHILANVESSYGLAEFALDRLSLAEAITEVGSGLHLLPSLSHPDLESFAQLGGAGRVASGIRKASRVYEFVVIDNASGASSEVEAIAHASDLAVLTLVPELTSISDAYGLYKRLTRRSRSLDCRLLANRIADESEADYIRAKFRALSERFLGHSPSWLAALPEDTCVRTSLGRQQPVAHVDEASAFARALARVAEKISKQLPGLAKATAVKSDNNINNLPAAADKEE
jgi:flagellar biosynthesis protein FlhG